MYHAKRTGTGGYAVFDDTMHQRVADRLARGNQLRQAIEQSLVGVDYQPIVDLESGEIAGLEALARWPAGSPEVKPSEFIQIAEDSGLIGPLGLHVLRTALATFAEWRRAGLVSEDTYLSVNISRRQLDDPALPEQILAAIAAAGVPAGVLRLEVTESSLMQTPERMQRIVSTVCAQGVCLHLDDFGTEYSSLAALLQFPVVALKIDRSFVTSLIGHGGRSEAIVRGAVALAHGLGLRAIAEGIEVEFPRFRRHLNASGRKPGKVRLRCRERGRRIRRSSVARRSVLPGWAISRSAGWRRIWGSPTSRCAVGSGRSRPLVASGRVG
jgi:EAL domain-containing protein (putative c-di-GMP-specific phosphodiesterase class I)